MVSYDSIQMYVTVSLVFQVLGAAGCPHKCRCDYTRKVVYCNQKSLISVPYGIPSYAETLYLQDNLLVSSQSLEIILSGLVNLRVLKLSQNRLTSVPQRMPNSLTDLYLDRNEIKFLGRKSFAGLGNLTYLNLRENNVTSTAVSSFAFRDTTNLRVLLLSKNSLTRVPVFPASIETLYLDNNNISSITGNLPTNLEQCYLGHNDIKSTSIGNEVFSELSRLNVLDISYNRLKDIPRNLPNQLKLLLLSHNEIRFIHNSIIDRGTVTDTDVASIDVLNGYNFAELDLSFNNITSVEPHMLDNCSIQIFHVNNNPWHCDCHLVYMKKWIADTSSLISSMERIKCESPEILKEVTLNSIDVEALRCSYDYSQRYWFENIESDQLNIRTLSADDIKPPFSEMLLIHSTVECQNCSSQDEISGEYLNAGNGYDVIRLEALSVDEVSNLSFTDLLPNTTYLFCMTDSAQLLRGLEYVRCKAANTKAKVASSDASTLVPLWLILVVIVVIILLILAIILVMIIRFYLKHKRAKSKRNCPTRDLFPREYIDQLLQRSIGPEEYPYYERSNQQDSIIYIRKTEPTTTT